MDIKLTGQQYRQLSGIIRDLFELDELKRELQFALDIKISNITLADSYEGVVFDVIGDSQRKGWTAKLLNATREARPEATQLLAFSREFNLTPLNTPDRPVLERIIKDTNTFLDVAKWRQNLGRIERQVCAIRMNGEPAGSGFLLGPDVVMTNYHVVNDVIDGKVKPESIEIIFDYKQLADGSELSEGKRYRLANEWQIDYSPYSPVDKLPPKNKTIAPRLDELDYALLRMNDSPGNEPFGDPQNLDAPLRGWLKPVEAPHDFLQDSPLFIMQHPKGKPLKLALETNSIISLNENLTRVTHRTNTEPGSSGSPCFDQNWNLVALHHSGDPKDKPDWNEGIPFTAILNLLKDRGKLGELDNPNGSGEL